MKVVVDPYSGFCGGVVKAIRLAEENSATEDQLYCLGEIVHNQAEVARLTTKGLKFINHDEFRKLKNVRVLIRAHGEPPETYKIAGQNGIELIDATCKVVKRLQQKVKKACEKNKDKNGQVVIFGKEDHPEVISLKGQVESDFIVIKSKNELGKIDFARPIHLFAQTTKSITEFEEIKRLIQNNLIGGNADFEATNSVCNQVSSREEKLLLFARENEVIVFVGGENSSNAKFLFGICKKNNPDSYFVSDETQVNSDWFKGIKSVGISGATSTPQWLMARVAEKIKAL